MPALICGPIQHHPHKICMNTHRISICHSTSSKSFMFIMSQSNRPRFFTLHFFHSEIIFVIIQSSRLVGNIQEDGGDVWAMNARSASLSSASFSLQTQRLRPGNGFKLSHQLFCQKQLLFRTISWQVIKHADWSRPPRSKRTAEMKLTLALAETQARVTNPSHALDRSRTCWRDRILRPTILFS